MSSCRAVGTMCPSVHLLLCDDVPEDLVYLLSWTMSVLPPFYGRNLLFPGSCVRPFSLVKMEQPMYFNKNVVYCHGTGVQFAKGYKVYVGTSTSKF